ncbi:MAG: hypothetical protein ACOZNI_12835 [Myxococcota bacterium]
MLAVLVAHAQTPPPVTWEPVVEVRDRVQGDGEVGELAQRARVGIEASRTIVSARVSFQEIRAWRMDRASVSPEGFSPDVAEAWGRVRGVLNRNIHAEATIGRQALRLHEGRLLGEDDFAMEGRFFDAFRVLGTAAPIQLEYINARRFVAGDSLGLGVNVVRAGGHHADPVTRWDADAVWLVDARRTDEVKQTGGAYVRVDSGRWRARVEAYAQPRDEGTGTLLAFSAGRVFGPNERWVVHLRGDRASGEASGAAWTPVLGDSRRFWGLLDRYGTAAEPRGLADLHLRVESRPVPQIGADVEVHRLYSPEDGGVYGHEVDGTVAWAFTPFSDLAAGAGAFVGEGGEADARFGYLELHVAF